MILPYIPKEYDQLTFTNALTGINDQLDNIQTSIDAINSSSNSTTSSVSANDPVVLGILNQINILGTSLQSLFDSLAAYANKYGASIQTWQTTLQTTSESFARKISVVTAGLNGNTAGITDIQSALVDLRSSTAEQINLLQSTFNQSVSTISTTLTTLATNDSAMASSITTLSAQVNNPTTGLPATKALVTAESSARASADSAISSTVTTLSAQVNDSSTGLPKTRADLSNEISTRASADSAISSTVTTLSAQVNDPTTGLAATKALVTAESSARASADSAISSTVYTLSTTVSGNTSTLSTYGSSINGLQALYGVNLDVNGYVSGFVMNNGSNYSTFKINADDFQIIKPGATAATFQVEGGQVKINGQLLVNGSTGSTQIANNAATNMLCASAYAWGQVTLAVTINTADLPSGSSTVPIVITGAQDVGSQAYFDIGLNTSNFMAAGNLFNSFPPYGGTYSMTIIYNATPGTYYFSCFNHGTGNYSDSITRVRTITAIVGKR